MIFYLIFTSFSFRFSWPNLIWDIDCIINNRHYNCCHYWESRSVMSYSVHLHFCSIHPDKHNSILVSCQNQENVFIRAFLEKYLLTEGFVLTSSSYCRVWTTLFFLFICCSSRPSFEVETIEVNKQKKHC